MRVQEIEDPELVSEQMLFSIKIGFQFVFGDVAGCLPVNGFERAFIKMAMIWNGQSLSGAMFPAAAGMNRV